MSYIEVRNLSYAYKDDSGDPVQVLRGINLDIEKGEYIAVLGHNGSGKSTLAKLLNLVIDDYDYFEGSITVDGKNITADDMTEDDVYDLRKKIGMVFQNPDNQLVATVVEEDVAFGPENLGIEPAEIRRRVDEALETVGMSQYKRHSPHQLSGGQKQRVAIAGIIAMLPECIVFDESTAMLDPRGRAEVMDTIERLNREKGITVIHITHNMDEAIRADRVVVISSGRVCLDGTPKQVFGNVEALRMVGLDVPQVTELLYDLKNAGFDVDHTELDEEKCADMIANLILKGKK